MADNENTNPRPTAPRPTYQAKTRRIDDPRMAAARTALLGLGMTPFMVGCAIAAAIEAAPSSWWPMEPRTPPTPPAEEKVVDLMAALEASVKEARAARRTHRG